MRVESVAMVAASIVIGCGIFLGATNATKADDAPAIFKTKCAVCHGAGGKGDSPAGKSMGAADLTKSAASKSAEDLKGTIEKGRNKMPAYGKSLKPGEIDGLVAYIKSLK
jgi:mono/diheme cytochrome c family protein